jgi:DNA-binding NarL/FixJ family response regulator
MIARTWSVHPTAKRRILVADDQPIYRQGLVSLLDREPDLMVCGQAATAAETMRQADRLKPDLLLLELALPGKNGIELLKDLKTLHPTVPVLIVSMQDESVYAERALRAGARGYVMKHEGAEHLLNAIRQVLGGQVHVSARMSEKILEVFSGRRAQAGASPVEQLSDREFEVFHLLGQGKSNGEIARSLHLSAKTVAVHNASPCVGKKPTTSKPPHDTSPHEPTRSRRREEADSHHPPDPSASLLRRLRDAWPRGPRTLGRNAKFRVLSANEGAAAGPAASNAFTKVTTTYRHEKKSNHRNPGTAQHRTGRCDTSTTTNQAGTRRGRANASRKGPRTQSGRAGKADRACCDYHTTRPV